MTSLFEIDLRVFRGIHLGWHNQILDLVFLVLSYLGLGLVQVALALISGFWSKRYMWPLVLSVLVTGLGFAQLLKALVPRDRPSQLWDAVPQEGFKIASFPSGHTTTAFGVAVTLILFAETPGQKRFGWVSLILAFGVGISRIYRGVHWPTDVFGGACAGTLGACILFLCWPSKEATTSVA